MTDLYDAAGTKELAITSCMPLLEQTEESQPRFYGALCLDHEPIGKLVKYFPIKSDPKLLPSSFTMLFNTDENYEEAT